MTWVEKQESSSLLPYKYTIKLIRPERIYQLLHSISMSKKFEYNFTAENELADLRDRVSELEEENTLLKQSLEELIKVNTELTESIEDFNNENMQQEYQAQQVMQMQQTIETLNNEIENLRREVDYGQYDPSRNGRKP